MCPAVHMSARILQRPSSTHEPSDPPFRVVSCDFRHSNRLVTQPSRNVAHGSIEIATQHWARRAQLSPEHLARATVDLRRGVRQPTLTTLGRLLALSYSFEIKKLLRGEHLLKPEAARSLFTQVPRL
jgi:hypothetical protein